MKQVKEVMNHEISKETLEASLVASFKEAMREESFQLLVEKLKLPKEILMKYVSILEKSAYEYHHCMNCPGLAACQNEITGYAYLPKVINRHLDFHYQACKYQNKYLKENRYQKQMLLFDMPKEIKEARMKDIYKKDKNRFPVIKWLDEFINHYQEKKRGLYLHGNFGSGKTYLIAAMFHELAELEITSAIVYWPEYLRDLKASFDTDFKEKFTMIKKVPLLLIDDIGAENMTAWGRDEILGPILQYRMQEQLPTFFTSNLTIKELEEHLSISKASVDVLKARRIIERIVYLSEDMEMISKNNRL